MDDLATLESIAPNPVPAGPAVAAADAAAQQIGSLLTRMQRPELAATAPEQLEARLGEVRLGVACSLFTALRCKHPPTAAHSLRVALWCSSWAISLELPEDELNELEVAALLHDIGKIAVPDALLLKPGSLATDEAQRMDLHRQAGLKILAGCCASPTILEVVKHSPAWYDGSRANHPMAGRNIPLGARMLSIVDAFDSMTSAQVYRDGLSRERAMTELFGFAGTQFDPDLVDLFSELQLSDKLHQRVASRWLDRLRADEANDLWQLQLDGDTSGGFLSAGLFQQRLLDNMHDAVIFVDRGGKIVLWNRGAERMTGISADAVCQRSWIPELVGMRNEGNESLPADDCPVAFALHTSVQSLRRLTIRGRHQRPVSVDVHAVPVLGQDGMPHGAVVLLHDASPETSLEKRCQSLYERATKDPLTQVANRAEFDRTHKMFVAAHLERRLPCSLIICDIDHFKQINDTYGHPAGDEALKSFAQLLKSCCRPGDLVARYGGEEFVMLCADCSNATAAARAEEIRSAVAAIPHAALEGKSFTVSFGVTEIQAGDTTETMLNRADRGLLEAKQRGRNTVVQLGSGTSEVEEAATTSSWFARRNAPIALEKWLLATVPLKMAVEKIRGFVADHHAEIVSIEGNSLQLKINGGLSGFAKRGSDRPIPMRVELRLTEERWAREETEEPTRGGRVSRTQVYVAIRPLKDRDRRRNNLERSARQLAASIKSYLMATELEAAPPNSSQRRTTNLFTSWLRKS